MKKPNLYAFCSGKVPCIPPVVIKCVAELEKRHRITERFIYLTSGVRSKSEKLLDELLENANRNLTSHETPTITTALKIFLLERIPEPLIPGSVRHIFLKAVRDSEIPGNPNTVLKEIARLPLPNRDTLAFLMVHLRNVTWWTRENEVGFNELVMVGPLLFEVFEDFNSKGQHGGSKIIVCFFQLDIREHRRWAFAPSSMQHLGCSLRLCRSEGCSGNHVLFIDAIHKLLGECFTKRRA